MRSIFMATVLFLATGVSIVPNSPFLRMKQDTENGKVQFIGKNISNKSIVAYVAVAEIPNHRFVWHGVYSGNDALLAGQTVELGELPPGSDADDVKAFVDYVRLADGTTWGKITTDDAKEVSARFRQQ